MFQKTKKIRGPITPHSWEVVGESTKTKSLKNEQRLGEEIGFKTTPGSGNTPWATKKGDGSHPEIMFELKETESDRISITTRGVGKLTREARNVGKEPAIVLSAYGLPEPIPKEWVCVTKEMFIAMLGAYNEKKGYE